jgi:hypothetical protein
VSTYCFDLDGTLCTNTEGEYEAARPQPWAIERVNTLRRAGHRVVIFTARGTTTGIDWRPETERQLAEWGVEYDELILGKPYADVYIDDKALHADAWRYGPAHELSGPGHAPLRSAAVVEVGRTFGGRPLYAADHAERLLAAAAASAIPVQSSAAEIEAAVAESTGAHGELLDPGDDVVFAIALEGAPAAAYLDSLDGRPVAELSVSCRLLSQPARGLARYGTPDAIRAATDGREGAWPLWTRTDGALADALGGVPALVTGDRITVGDRGDVAVRRLAEAGFELVEGAVTADAGELLIVGMPFCVLGVSELDGRPLKTGDARQKLLAAWSDSAGIDLLKQVSALTRLG